MGPCRLIGEEKAGAFQHIIDTDVTPAQVIRIAFGCGADHAVVDDQLVVLNQNFSGEATVGRVVSKQIGQVVNIDQIIDAHHFHVGVGDGLTKGKPTDSAKPVDPDANGHDQPSTFQSGYRARARDCSHPFWGRPQMKRISSRLMTCRPRRQSDRATRLRLCVSTTSVVSPGALGVHRRQPAPRRSEAVPGVRCR